MSARHLEDALKALLAASEQRAVVTAVQHYTGPAVKQQFLKARQGAKLVLSDLYELCHLRDLSLAGMSSLSRVGKLSKRDARKLAELEEKYGR